LHARQCVALPLTCSTSSRNASLLHFLQHSLLTFPSNLNRNSHISLATLLHVHDVTMNEMLGNRFFMIRNYAAAAHEFEAVLAADPHTKPVRKKLIICYVQLGQIPEALELFLGLVEEDTEFIINTDPEADDCPCPELIFEEENGVKPQRGSKTSLAALGILWLYCDIHKSLEYFEQASLAGFDFLPASAQATRQAGAQPDDDELSAIVQKLREYTVHTKRGSISHGVHG